MEKPVIIQELVEVKYQVMLRRIHDLQNAFRLLLKEEMALLSFKKLGNIKMQYEKMYISMIRTQQYDKYEEIEKTIAHYIAQLDNKLDEYVYSTFNQAEYIINSILETIMTSTYYQDFSNMEKILSRISGVEELLRRYVAYIPFEKGEDLQNRLSEVKFNCLLRAQVELILEGDR